MKTDIEIRDDIYLHLKGSKLAKAVTGQLRNRPERPRDSQKEDICIDVLSNDGGNAEQLAVVLVRIYVPDQPNKGNMEECTKRLRELARIADETLDRHNGGDYLWWKTSIKTYEAEGMNEHFIAVKLTYKQNND